MHVVVERRKWRRWRRRRGPEQGERTAACERHAPDDPPELTTSSAASPGPLPAHVCLLAAYPSLIFFVIFFIGDNVVTIRVLLISLLVRTVPIRVPALLRPAIYAVARDLSRDRSFLSTPLGLCQSRAQLVLQLQDVNYLAARLLSITVSVYDLLSIVSVFCSPLL